MFALVWGLAPRATAKSAAAGFPHEQAAHLLRRAGFGGTPEQVESLVRLGRRKAVEKLLNDDNFVERSDRPAIRGWAPPDRVVARGANMEDQRQRLQMERFRQEQDDLQQMRCWWLARMAETHRPLEEKMVLFWHGHFTSGMREVKSAYALWRQNELFRRNAVGNFRTLLLEVTKDPAMILYLNNAQNIKEHPNENYARELMELFTLGVGRYSEQDVKEAARAFTGWSIDRDTGEFRFRARQHDYGPKMVLGRRGNLDGADVIDIILARPETSEHLVRQLWRFFASDDPPSGVVKQLATVLRKNNYEMKPLLRALFNHPAFYNPSIAYTHVKSPVEMLVGTMRSLEIKPVDTRGLVLGLRQMGQDLFQPPNVKGWDGGLTWINTATLYNRYNVTSRLISGSQDLRPRRDMMMPAATRGDDLAAPLEAPPTAQPPWNPAPLIACLNPATPEDVVDGLVDRLIGRPIAANRRELLIQTFQTALSEPDNIASPQNAQAVRELVMLIIATPEYQLS